MKEEAVFEHKIIDLDLPLRRVTMRDYDNAVREIVYYIEKNKDKEAFNYEDGELLVRKTVEEINKTYWRKMYYEKIFITGKGKLL